MYLYFVLFTLNAIFEVPGEATVLAAKKLKANILLFLIIIITILIMSFFTLMAALAFNNVLMSVNRKLSIVAAVLRLIEGLVFIISMIMLFLETASFNLGLLLSRSIYAFYLIFIGYLVFKSGYLNRLLGISLVIGGTMGYLTVGLTHSFFPSFKWISTIGIVVVVIAEFALGILLIIKAIKLASELPDPKETITMILEDLGEATTAEIIVRASQVSQECKDRIPNTLVTLEKEKKVIKRISKEKKALVWTLVG